jgi:hypothetical protein
LRREAHGGFCERRRVKLPPPTLLQIGRVGDEHAQCAADQRLVVGEDYADRHQSTVTVDGVGSTAATRKPPSGRGPA